MSEIPQIPLEFVAMKMAEAHAHAVAAERAEIVAYLYRLGWTEVNAFEIDQDIERGEHLTREDDNAA